jgi:hypothetical protein
MTQAEFRRTSARAKLRGHTLSKSAPERDWRALRSPYLTRAGELGRRCGPATLEVGTASASPTDQTPMSIPQSASIFACTGPLPPQVICHVHYSFSGGDRRPSAQPMYRPFDRRR